MSVGNGVYIKRLQNKSPSRVFQTDEPYFSLNASHWRPTSLAAFSFHYLERTLIRRLGWRMSVAKFDEDP